MTRIRLDKLEFYITNVCNLTCSGCNRYNNYKFAGWEDFDDYEEILTRWAEKIDIVKPVVLGGEPLLNPSINKWLRGIRRIWPDHAPPQVQSNGTRVDLVPGLYETCLETKAWIGISLHSMDDLDPIVARIKNFLNDPKPTPNPDGGGSAVRWSDTNGVNVHIWFSDHFTQSNIIPGPAGEFRLYESDPIKAHANCSFVRWKNYHMIDGKIHKCGPAPLMQQFDQQYPFAISESDRELIHSYRGLSVDEFDERGEEFFRTLDDPIAQCKFCPESYEYKKITFSNLKPNKI
jgi:MoaA/NifB/PqqE/SkfB family radical SAM enzyme